MVSDLFDELSRIRTIDDMFNAFQDEEHCRYLMKILVWTNGRICPACSFRRSIISALGMPISIFMKWRFASHKEPLRRLPFANQKVADNPNGQSGRGLLCTSAQEHAAICY